MTVPAAADFQVLMGDDGFATVICPECGTQSWPADITIRVLIAAASAHAATHARAEINA